MIPNLMFKHEDKSEVVFDVACACHDPDHQAQLRVIKDGPRAGSIEISMQFNASYRGFWNRLAQSIRYIFTGRLDVYADIMLSSDNIPAFKAVLNKVDSDA